MTIPRRETRTSTDLAQEMGKENCVGSVGHCITANPLPIIVPCHRVIYADGSLRESRLGPNVTRLLLALEGYAP